MILYCFVQELKAQFELHKHIRDEAAAHMETALGVIPVADENTQRQLQAQLMQKYAVKLCYLSSLRVD